MDNATSSIEGSEDELRWVTHPMAEYPWKAVVFWAVFLLVLAAVWAYTHEWIFVILSGLILLASLRGFVLPTRYKIDHKGIEVDRTFYKVRKSWDDFRSYAAERNGVFLSPFSVKHRMENFRGLFVPTGRHHKEVVDLVGKHLQKME
jgi:uncharacterized membrane protein